MICPLCDEAVATLRDHHDHLRDLAGDHLARILPPTFRQQKGPLEDDLQRSAILHPHLRFAKPIAICNDCNTLENSWKLKSNRNRHNPGFLPTYFTLLPHEIRTVRSKRDVSNNEPAVRDALKSIWLEQRDAHLRRRLLVMREVREFLLRRGIL